MAEQHPRTISRRPVAVGTRCARCGYDLRGIDSEGLCPECGEPAAHADRDGETTPVPSPHVALLAVAACIWALPALQRYAIRDLGWSHPWTTEVYFVLWFLNVALTLIAAGRFWRMPYPLTLLALMFHCGFTLLPILFFT